MRCVQIAPDVEFKLDAFPHDVDDNTREYDTQQTKLKPVPRSKSD